MSVEQNALKKDPVALGTDSPKEFAASDRPGLAPAPRPRKPLKTEVDFAAELARELRDLWERKRTSLAQVPLTSAFDPLDLREWEDNLLVLDTQRGFDGDSRFKVTKQGRALGGYFGADLTGSLMPELKTLDSASNACIWPVLQLVDSAYRSKHPRDRQFTGVSGDGAILRADILVLPLSDSTGARVDRLLLLIYSEETTTEE